MRAKMVNIKNDTTLGRTVLLFSCLESYLLNRQVDHAALGGIAGIWHCMRRCGLKYWNNFTILVDTQFVKQDCRPKRVKVEQRLCVFMRFLLPCAIFAIALGNFVACD